VEPDAWFDICTSVPGLDRMLAAGEAIFAELPLACCDQERQVRNSWLGGLMGDGGGGQLIGGVVGDDLGYGAAA
jgi:hypothetical protein